MANELYFKQPKYYSKFHCIGGKCSYNCCQGWRISWKKEEIDKLKNADISDKLRTAVKNNFIEDKNNNIAIKLNSTGMCPFIEEGTGLCSIQKEMGEEFLSHTCRHYPRIMNGKNNIVSVVCHSTCPAVIKLLMDDEKAMRQELLLIRDPEVLDHYKVGTYGSNILGKIPYIKYSDEIKDFYINLFCDNLSFEDTMIHGIYASENISQVIKNQRNSEIPNLLSQMSKLRKTAAGKEAAKKVPRDIQLKLKLTNTIITYYCNRNHEEQYIYSFIKDNALLLDDNYISGTEKFARAIKNRDSALKNICLNIFLELLYSIKNYECDKIYDSFFKFYTFFTVICAVVQVYASHTAFTSDNIKNDFIRIISSFLRSLTQGHISAGLISDLTDDIGIISSQQLASVIK